MCVSTTSQPSGGSKKTRILYPKNITDKRTGPATYKHCHWETIVNFQRMSNTTLCPDYCTVVTLWDQHTNEVMITEYNSLIHHQPANTATSIYLVRYAYHSMPSLENALLLWRLRSIAVLTKRCHWTQNRLETSTNHSLFLYNSF